MTNRLLLVEDDEEDIVHFQRLVRRADGALGVDVVTDGDTAIRWLAEKLAEADGDGAVLPRMIFVDLRLPGASGADVLRWIRAQPALDRTVAVVCSSSADARDITEAERSGADLYVTKYPDESEFAALLKVTDPRSLRMELRLNGRRR